MGFELGDIEKGNGNCPHCGHIGADTKHLLWDCPAINEKRKHKDLDNLKSDWLPKATISGLAVEMAIETNGTFWGPNYDAVIDTENLQNIRNMSKNKEDKPLAMGINELNNDYMLKEAYEQYNVNVSSNARQTFQHIKHSKTTSEIPMPYKVYADAPETPNVYTDGSWLHGTKQFLGIGGAGVWWPKRVINKDSANVQNYKPISDGEERMVYYEQDLEGLSCYSNIGGYSGSSTRTELAAGILAILAHGPIHIASDNQGFVNKTIALRKRINDQNDHKINWGVQKDGDLWEIFHRAIKAKGTRAVRIKWVKGHADDKHVEQGLCTREDVIGNDIADKHADKGALVFGKDVHEVAKCMHERHDSYLSFMRKVGIHIVEAYLIHRAKLETYFENPERASAQNYSNQHVSSVKNETYKRIWYPQRGETQKLDAKNTLPNYVFFAKKERASRDVEAFLHEIEIHQKPARFISWMELYLVYRIRGYMKPLEVENIMQNRHTLDKQLGAFKRTVRGTSERLFEGCDFALKAAKGKKDDLRGVGILGKLPSLNINVYITEKERLVIERCLHMLNHCCTEKNGMTSMLARRRS